MRTSHLYVAYRDRVGDQLVPLVVLEVLNFDPHRFGITRVVHVDPHGLHSAWERDKLARVQKLLGKDFSSFGHACQHVYATARGEKGAHISYMQAFEVYVRGYIDASLLGTWQEDKPVRGEWEVQRFSPGLAAVAVETLAVPPIVCPDPPTEQWEGWITVGEGRPYSHINTPPQSVEAAVQRMLSSRPRQEEEPRRARPARGRGAPQQEAVGPVPFAFPPCRGR